MIADKFGSPADQKRFRANWKNPKYRKLEDIAKEHCGICTHEKNRYCNHPDMMQKTLQTSTCDHYQIDLVIADIRKSMNRKSKA